MNLLLCFALCKKCEIGSEIKFKKQKKKFLNEYYRLISEICDLQVSR